MNPEQQAEQRIKLKPFYLYWRSQLPTLADHNLETVIRNGVMYMRTWILMKHTPVTKSKVVTATKIASFIVPATWWDHLKEGCFLKHFLSVKYVELKKEVTFEEEVKWDEGPIRVCPHSNRYLEIDHLEFLDPRQP